MSQYDETQFYICGEKNNMINYKGNVFSILYPRDQIEEDIVNDCLNCKIYGSWNGCQIMRCINCDTFGCGAINKGVEFNGENPLSANQTYLKGVDWSQIGDTELENSAEICGLRDSLLIQIVDNKTYLIDMRELPYLCVPFDLYTSTKYE